MNQKKNILVCPLNWGLGHATRCIPIINILKENGHKVIIATSGNAFQLLKNTFPNDIFINFKDYNIKFPRGNVMIKKLFWQLPKIFFRICLEHHRLKKIIRKFDIQTVISDNRFGLWNKKIHSVYITHQVQIKSQENSIWQEKLLLKIHSFFIKKYKTCLIPDYETGFRLAGELSNNRSISGHSQYIGLLSRFEKKNVLFQEEFDICAIISGPEPQRSIFQKILIEQIQQSNLKAVLFPGTTSEIFVDNFYKNIHIYSNASIGDIQTCISKSRFVIARSGYSTIMDLATLGKKAILIPTPGQTEQEYLASYLFERGYFYTQKQQDFNLKTAFAKVNEYTGIFIPKDIEKLRSKILSSV